MANKIRFVDNLKVGAYKTLDEGSNLEIFNNLDNRLTTATGNPNELTAEENLVFSGSSLGISTISPQAKLDIRSTLNEDLLLIKNGEDQGIKVNKEGALELIQYETLPTASQGAIAYSNNNFWVGIE